MTDQEQQCCFFKNCFDQDALDEWRKEFWQTERSEHCDDCPLHKEAA